MNQIAPDEPARSLRATLLLSIQRALLGAVSANLRAVSGECTGTQVRLRFLYDGEVDAGDVDSAQVVGSEVIADFPSPWTIDEEIWRLDYPADPRPHSLAHWAYLRKEP